MRTWTWSRCWTHLNFSYASLTFITNFNFTGSVICGQNLAHMPIYRSNGIVWIIGLLFFLQWYALNNCWLINLWPTCSQKRKSVNRLLFEQNLKFLRSFTWFSWPYHSFWYFFFTPSIPLSDFAWFAIFGLKSGLLQINWLCQTLIYLVTFMNARCFYPLEIHSWVLDSYYNISERITLMQNSGWKKIKSNLQELQQDS